MRDLRRYCTGSVKPIELSRPRMVVGVYVCSVLFSPRSAEPSLKDVTRAPDAVLCHWVFLWGFLASFWGWGNLNPYFLGILGSSSSAAVLVGSRRRRSYLCRIICGIFLRCEFLFSVSFVHLFSEFCYAWKGPAIPTNLVRLWDLAVGSDELEDRIN